MIDFGLDIFNEDNNFGLSFECMFYNDKTTDIYKRKGPYEYEYSSFNEYALYFAVHYSLLKFGDNKIFIGGTLGLGYHGAYQSGGGESFGDTLDLSGMKERDIETGLVYKIGGYVTYCIDGISFKGLIEYKTFGGFSFGFGIGVLF